MSVETLCCSLATAGNKKAMQLPYRPSPHWGREKNGKKKANLVGQGKGNLTEQQAKGTVTTTIQIRRIHKTNSKRHRATLTMRCPACSRAMNAFPPASFPARTQHNSTWYGIPYSVWPGWVSLPGCVPSWLLVKINLVLAEPRTPFYSVCHYVEEKKMCWFLEICPPKANFWRLKTTLGMYYLNNPTLLSIKSIYSLF